MKIEYVKDDQIKLFIVGGIQIPNFVVPTILGSPGSSANTEIINGPKQSNFLGHNIFLDFRHSSFRGTSPYFSGDLLGLLLVLFSAANPNLLAA